MKWYITLILYSKGYKHLFHSCGLLPCFLQHLSIKHQNLVGPDSVLFLIRFLLFSGWIEKNCLSHFHWLNLERTRFQASRLKAVLESFHHLIFITPITSSGYASYHCSTNILCTWFPLGFGSLFRLLRLSALFQLHYEKIKTPFSATQILHSPGKLFMFFQQLKCHLPLNPHGNVCFPNWIDHYSIYLHQYIAKLPMSLP